MFKLASTALAAVALVGASMAPIANAATTKDDVFHTRNASQMHYRVRCPAKNVLTLAKANVNTRIRQTPAANAKQVGLLAGGTYAPMTGARKTVGKTTWIQVYMPNATKAWVASPFTQGAYLATCKAGHVVSIQK